MTQLHTTNEMSYRPYIGGLRGIAIIAVLLYHAKLFFVTGGFVGVDIFFVISGFLITSIIVRDLKAGRFSLLGFWERRIRRILPALAVVMLFSIVAAYFFILYPQDYQHFGNTIIAQSVFASNMVFMLSDNYFDQPSKYSPLLNTWSLSVEEQFYLLFPFMVLCGVWLSGVRMLGWFRVVWARITGIKRTLGKGCVAGVSPDYWKGKGIVIAMVVFLGVASFLLNVWFVTMIQSSAFRFPFIPEKVFGNTTYAAAGFYLLPTRAWELALGILAALIVVKIRLRLLAEAIACGGIAAIVFAIFFLNDQTLFPGIAALLPTLGAVALIVANESHRTFVGRIISNRIFIGAGLISYSLYLWHWPLLVFAQLASPDPLSLNARIGVIVVSILVAWLSYVYIETPFRKKTFIPDRKNIFFLAGATITFLILCGFLIQQLSLQLTYRIPLAAKDILSASDENVPWGGVCFERPGDESRYGGLCRIGDARTTGAGKFVVWGDSHAEALVPLFNIVGQSREVSGVVFDGGDCVPIEGVHQVPPATGCEEEKAFALQYIRDNDIKHIILAARWSYYVHGGINEKQAALITDAQSTSVSSENAKKVFERNLVPMVQQLSNEGREVYIVEQVPEQFDLNLRDTFYQAVHTGVVAQFSSIRTENHEAYQKFPNAVIDGLRVLPGVHVINPATILCAKGGFCKVENEGKLIYRDESHLSTFGAMSLESLFTSVFASF